MTAHPVAATALLGVVAGGVQLFWIFGHRHLGGFDGDESGYLATALRFRSSLADGGVGALSSDVLHNYRSGPLMPLLSVPFLMLGGSFRWALVVQPIFYVITAVALSAIVARVTSRSAGLVAGVLSLGLPVNLLIGRSYHLAAAVSAFLCLALWSLVASRGGQDRLRMMAFGLAVGAMLLTRTVTVAFLPGLAVAALLLVRPTWRTVVNLGLAATVAVAVAAPWWVTSWDSIEPYLTKFGYGRGAADLGSPSVLGRALERIGVMYIEVRPLLFFPGIVVLVMVGRVVFRRLRRSPRSWPPSATGVAALGIVVVAGWSCLLTTSNLGTFVQSPLVALGAATVVAAAGHLTGPGVRRLAAVVLTVAVANVALISNWDIGSGIDLSGVSASMLVFGGFEAGQAINFADGDPRFEASASDRDRARAEHEWAAAETQLAYELERVRPEHGPMMRTFVGDVRLLEAGTLELATRVSGDGVSEWEAPTARSAVGDGKVDLSPRAGAALRVLVAVRTRRRSAQEGFSPAPIVDRALAAGWHIVSRVPLPDGGDAVILLPPGHTRRG